VVLKAAFASQKSDSGRLAAYSHTIAKGIHLTPPYPIPLLCRFTNLPAPLPPNL